MKLQPLLSLGSGTMGQMFSVFGSPDLSGYQENLISVGFPELWIFIFIFFDLAAFAWIRLNFGVSFDRTLEAVFNFQTAARMYNDNSQLQRQLDSFLNFYYYLNGAFFLLIIEQYFKVFPLHQEGLLLFLLNFTILATYNVVRTTLVKLTGFLFDHSDRFREYNYHVSNYNKIIGIAVAPFLLFLAYAPDKLKVYLLWILIVVLSSVYILRIIRVLLFSRKRNVFILYMFLYLCALEIVPLLLLFKWTESVI